MAFLLCTAAAFLAAPGAMAAANPPRPNVVVLVADDLGSGDVSCLFRQAVKTPNLDRLATTGVTFRQGYVSAPLCAPSRAGFFSGRYQQRFGFENNQGGIPADVQLLPAAFRQAGYATCLLGKWHSQGPQPNQRGFEEFLGYFGPFLDYQHPRLNHNGQPEPHDEYSSALFAREAERYLEQHRDKPFLLTVAFNAPHIQRVVKNAQAIRADFDQARAQGRQFEIPKIPTAPPAEADKYRAQFPADAPRADTVATIAALDQAVGRILDKLQQTGLATNTILFFFSDNGGHPENRSENLPLRDYKWSMYEGGIRVPFFAVFPGVFRPGQQFQSPVSTLDIFPTCAALAGVKTPNGLDGVNLAPYLSGEKQGPPHPTLCWRMDNARAIRQGKWKLVFGDTEPRLFDLEQDLEEKNNLAAQHPELVATLQQAWNQWNAPLPQPPQRLGKK